MWTISGKFSKLFFKNVWTLLFSLFFLCNNQETTYIDMHSNHFITNRRSNSEIVVFFKSEEFFTSVYLLLTLNICFKLPSLLVLCQVLQVNQMRFRQIILYRSQYTNFLKKATRQISGKTVKRWKKDFCAVNASWRPAILLSKKSFR